MTSTVRATEEILDDADWEVGDDGIRVKDGQRLPSSSSSVLGDLVANKPAYELGPAGPEGIGLDLQLTVLPHPGLLGHAADAAYRLERHRREPVAQRPRVLNLQYSPVLGNGAWVTEDWPAERRSWGARRARTTSTPRRGAARQAGPGSLLEKHALVNPIAEPPRR